MTQNQQVLKLYFHFQKSFLDKKTNTNIGTILKKVVTEKENVSLNVIAPKLTT